jgi:hypothetical protein
MFLNEKDYQFGLEFYDNRAASDYSAWPCESRGCMSRKVRIYIIQRTTAVAGRVQCRSNRLFVVTS